MIPEIIEGTWSVLRKRVRRLHGIRVAAKRMRYATEAVAPVVGRRAVALAEAVGQLQTILGDQHDAVIACARLRALPTAGGTAFVAGELALLERQSAAAARRDWTAAWCDVKRAHRALRRAF